MWEISWSYLLTRMKGVKCPSIDVGKRTSRAWEIKDLIERFKNEYRLFVLSDLTETEFHREEVLTRLRGHYPNPDTS